MTYAKFYINPPGSQPLPHQKEQASVRPGPYQPLGPVSVRRRSAAHGCANAHPTTATGNLSPSEVGGYVRQCAGAPATRRSCGRHRGSDGAVEAARRHQTLGKRRFLTEWPTRDPGNLREPCHKVSVSAAPISVRFGNSNREAASGTTQTLWRLGLSGSTGVSPSLGPDRGAWQPEGPKKGGLR